MSDGGVVLRKGDNDGSLFEHDGLSLTGEICKGDACLRFLLLGVGKDFCFCEEPEEDEEATDEG